MMLSCSPSISIKGDWKVVSAYEVKMEGQLMQPYISFQDSGRVAGSTGVNFFSGEYSSKGEVLSFGDMDMTRRASADMEAESAIVKALHSATSFRSKDGDLIIRDAEGKDVMVLRKKEK
ncbi:MAG: META domain-containing protein [Paludibacteraceae bacterium]|nr:META domain-containing protein [Paludibacteraceae bacterium]